MTTPADPDLTPVKPYPGFEAKAEPTRRTGPRVTVLPAEPRLWSTTVPLEFPVTVDGELLSQITIRRPTGGDVSEEMLEDPEESTLPMRVRARMCGIDQAVFVGLWADDSERVLAACRPFLPSVVVEIDQRQAAAGAPFPGEA